MGHGDGDVQMAFGEGLSFRDWIDAYSDDLIFYTRQHALLSLYCILVAAIIAIVLAIAVYRSPRLSTLAISSVSVGFTLPSVALFGVLIPVLGRDLASVFPVVVLYSLLPALRNTIVGLQSVDAAMLDAARGMGMSRFRMLWQIELPLAWPVILAGLRVSAQLAVGIVAIGALVYNVGLGQYAFHALANLGSANTANEALACVIFVAAIGIAFDLAFVLVRRFTTPRGLRV
jgi:osmoprotectant transport system permease protein